MMPRPARSTPREPSRAAAALRAWLQRAGLSQHAFAREAGVSVGSVAGWLSGDSVPSLERAAWLQDRTGIPAAEWVRHDRDEKTTG